MPYNTEEQVRVPILKFEGVIYPVENPSNYEGWILCDRSLSRNASLLCIVAQFDLDLLVGIKEGDHLIIGVDLDPEVGEYAATLFAGCPRVGVIVEFGSSLALDVGDGNLIQLDDENVVLGCVVALIRKF